MIPVLETPRLYLRPLTMDDFADFYEYAQDIEVSGPGMWTPYPDENTAREDFARLLGLYSYGLMWWALEVKTTHKMIGRCQLAEYDPDDGRAELSYALNRHFWGQGYITEAARAVLQYGFDVLALNRISAQVFTDNEGSIRVLEKLGMVREGRLRQHRRTRGQPEDVYIYSILQEDWRRL